MILCQELNSQVIQVNHARSTNFEIRKMKILIIFLSIFCHNVFAKYDILKVPRPDGSIITAYLNYPEKLESLSILINIGGSTCKSEYSPKQASENYSKYKFSVLKVEKYGIDETFSKSQCGDVYRKFNNIHRRAKDTLIVLKYIKENYRFWNGQIYILGGSEGAIVAPLIAKNPKLDIRSMALWAGGRSMTMSDEFLLNIKKNNYICSDISKSKDSYIKKFSEIRKTKQSTKLWCSAEKSNSINSYQWWSHILTYNPLSDFLSFKGNLYIAHGSLDRMMPIESSLRLRDIFKDKNKNNLIFREHKGLNHSCMNNQGESKCGIVYGEIQSWLYKEMSKNP